MKTRLHSVCFFIHAIIFAVEKEYVIGKAIDMEADSIKLVQISSTVKDPLGLLKMNLENRTHTCRSLQNDVTVLILRLEPKKKFHVPVAQVYEFDGKETYPTIRCPTVPAIYAYRKHVESSKYQWYIRRLKPQIGPFEYNVEIAESIAFPKVPSPTRDIVSSRHRFFTMSLEERWYLCSNTRPMIRYKVTQKGYISEPYTFVFQYPNGRETYVAFSCETEPSVYLHTGHSDNCDVITITLVDFQLENAQLISDN